MKNGKLVDALSIIVNSAKNVVVGSIGVDFDNYIMPDVEFSRIIGTI